MYNTVLHFYSRKRQLLPTNITDLWQPDTCKKLYVSVQGLSKNGNFSFFLYNQNDSFVIVYKEEIFLPAYSVLHTYY